jgi:hypothetical protein
MLKAVSRATGLAALEPTMAMAARAIDAKSPRTQRTGGGSGMDFRRAG